MIYNDANDVEILARQLGNTHSYTYPKAKKMTEAELTFYETYIDSYCTTTHFFSKAISKIILIE